jgi:hypothetical protein
LRCFFSILPLHDSARLGVGGGKSRCETSLFAICFRVVSFERIARVSKTPLSTSTFQDCREEKDKNSEVENDAGFKLRREALCKGSMSWIATAFLSRVPDNRRSAKSCVGWKRKEWKGKDWRGVFRNGRERF